MTDNKQPENRQTDMNGGNYNERIEGDYIQGRNNFLNNTFALFALPRFERSNRGQPQLEKFTLAPRNNYVAKRKDGMLLAEQVGSSAFPIFDVGVSNPGANSVYITGIWIEAVNFQPLQLQIHHSGKLIERITVVLKKNTNDADLQALMRIHNLILERRYERLCNLIPLSTFTEEDLLKLQQSSILESVEETAIGQGYARIDPSSFIEAEGYLNSQVKTIEILADQEIPAHGVDRFWFSVKFNEAGIYELNGIILCGCRKSIQLPRFQVAYKN